MSQLEDEFAFQALAYHLPEYESEYRFHSTRKWRFDFAWPDVRVAVEVEGGTWAGGRHVTGGGFEKDCEKYNEAAALGWRVFRFTRKAIKDGTAIALMKVVLDGRQDGFT